MNKNRSLSIAGELASDTMNILQNNVLQQFGDYPAKTFYRNDVLANLSPGMAQAIQESIEVSFGK